MVYCGPPSKGCRNCRQRKIRCDQKTPVCGQCTKANKECPGYRNMLDLAFRNESSSVIEKANKKSATPRPSGPSSKRSSSHISSQLIGDVSPTSTHSSDLAYFHSSGYDPRLSYDNLANDIDLCSASSISTFSMHPTTEEIGINFFFSNFVAPATGPSHGYFSYVPDLCRETGLNDTLIAAIKAIGLANHANSIKSSELMAEARLEYSIALRGINVALTTPTESVKDSTLLSIMLVSMFETTTGGNRLSLKAWTDHVNGATTLLALRGSSQLRTSIGHRLFIHVTSHLLTSCMQREIPMPVDILEMRREAFSLVPSDPGFEFLRVTDQYTLFRAALKNGHIPDSEIIPTALKFDRDMVHIFSDVPSGWLYETVHNATDFEMAYNGSYDIYYDAWIAQIWNSMRLCRMMLHESIRYHLLQRLNSPSPGFTFQYCVAQLQASTDILIDMRDGILRSIPQGCGLVTRKPFTYTNRPKPTIPKSPTPPLPNSFDNFSFTDLLNDLATPSFSPPNPAPTTSPALARTLSTPHTGPKIGGYFLLWPVYVAGNSFSTPTLRKLIISRLRYIGETMGISQGAGLANALEQNVFFLSGRKGTLKRGLIGMTDSMNERCVAVLKEARDGCQSCAIAPIGPKDDPGTV